MGNVNIINRSEFKGLSDDAEFLDIKLVVSKHFAVFDRDGVIYVKLRTEKLRSRSDISGGLIDFDEVYSKEICAALDRGIKHLFVNLPALNCDKDAYDAGCLGLNLISWNLISVQDIDITYVLPDNKKELYSELREAESETRVARYGCKCTKCGKYFMVYDAQEKFTIDTGIIGFGSQYDECSIKIDLCVDCFDELMQKLIPRCKENPVTDRSEECK